MTPRSRMSRRVALGIVAAAAGVTVVVREWRLMGGSRHSRPSPYDDLIAKLGNREAGARFGSAVLERPQDRPSLAAQLRQRLQRETLSDLSRQELSEGRVAEVGGWIVPRSLALLCGLAAAP